MKKITKLLMLLVGLVAMFVSPDVAIAVSVGANGSDTDPNDGKPLNNATPDDLGKGIDQQGNAATGSAITQAELEENSITDFVSKYKAHKFPMHTDLLRKAQQIPVDTKEPDNYEIAEPITECVTKSKLSADNTSETAILPLYGNDKKLFAECRTVVVAAVVERAAGDSDGASLGGYDASGNFEGSPLVLYVESVASGNVTVRALNGPLNAGHTYVPTIPAGTTLMIMAPAMTESEIEIRPDNFLPQPRKCYLQKKVCAITVTDFFKRIKKKAKWNYNDVKDAILFKFRKDRTRTLLLSVPTKFTKENPKTGVEYGYTEEGVLRQLRLAYQLEDGKLTFADLIGMTAMLFGSYDAPNEMTAYCGRKFIERFLNIDFKKHNEVIVRNYQDEATKINYTSFESTFGKLNFVYEPALDDAKYGDCAIIYDPAQSRRFIYENEKTLKVDHNKGEGGEVREAKSEYYIQDDCLSLRGFNSMIVGPASLISGFNLSPIEATIKSVDTLPALGVLGDIVYLTGDGENETNPVGLYKCTTASVGAGGVGGSGTAAVWSPYDGKDINA